jgi:hypothetical protein
VTILGGPAEEDCTTAHRNEGSFRMASLIERSFTLVTKDLASALLMLM